MIVDIEAQWLGDIERQGLGYDYGQILQQWYGALRGLGLDVDFVAPLGDLDGYRLVLAPALVMPTAATVEWLRASTATIVFGPRSGAKTRDVTIPEALAPGALQALLPCRVLAVETLRADCTGTIAFDGAVHISGRWREMLDAGRCEIIGRYEDDSPALVRSGRFLYLATLTDDGLLTALFAKLCDETAIDVTVVAGGLRLRRRGELTFAINYGSCAVDAPAPADAHFILGQRRVPPRDLAIWKRSA